MILSALALSAALSMPNFTLWFQMEFCFSELREKFLEA